MSIHRIGEFGPLTEAALGRWFTVAIDDAVPGDHRAMAEQWVRRALASEAESRRYRHWLEHRGYAEIVRSRMRPLERMAHDLGLPRAWAEVGEFLFDLTEMHR